MAKPNTSMRRVRIKVDPDHPGRGMKMGPGKPDAKPGDVVELPTWLALHEIEGGICVEVK